METEVLDHSMRTWSSDLVAGQCQFYNDFAVGADHVFVWSIIQSFCYQLCIRTAFLLDTMRTGKAISNSECYGVIGCACSAGLPQKLHQVIASS